MISRADALVILLAASLVVGSSAWLWTPAAPGAQVRVIQSEREILRLPLNRDDMVDVTGPAGITRVEIRDGAARCAVSPGIHGICQSAGWLQQAGDVAVSLPNRIIIEVLGAPADFDSMNH